jgi:hypothetical protein
MEQLDLFTERLPARPYCTDDFAFGLMVRPKASAARCRYIQPNTPFAISWLVFDIDHPDGAIRWEDMFIPPPSIIVANATNGHAHLLYAIKTPVFSTPDHPKPLRLAAAIQEAMREKLDGDPGYAGLITKNPLHPDWRVIVWPMAVYELEDLACWVDLSKPKKRPRKEEIGLGRNCSLFDRLRHWAYRWIATYKDTATADEWGRVVFAQAAKLNDFNLPLHESEVRAIAKSTAKWCWGRFDIQASNERFSKLQAVRGKKGGVVSGVARLAKNADKREEARLMRAQGQSYRQIAEALGVSRRSIIYWCNEAIIR